MRRELGFHSYLMLALMVRIFDLKCGAHPGMNAALEVGCFACADRRTRDGLSVAEENVAGAGRLRNELAVRQSLRALRGYDWVT
jgi:hypothetical protein